MVVTLEPVPALKAYGRPMLDRLADFRAVFAQALMVRAGCPTNTRLADAFAKVPRHQFFEPGPWVVCEDGSKTASSDPALLYQDIGLELAPGVPTGLPSLHALLINAIGVQPGNRVMHVGAGTGYYTAILAELVGESGHVCAFELDATVAARAATNLQPWPWAHVESRSGVTAPHDPVDVVYVNAGVEQLPLQWLRALRPGGRLLLPLVSGTDSGAMFVVENTGGQSYAAQFALRARVVACLGSEDERARARVAELLHEPCAAVRSLRLGAGGAADDVWFAGDGWSLSTAEP